MCWARSPESSLFVQPAAGSRRPASPDEQDSPQMRRARQALREQAKRREEARRSGPAPGSRSLLRLVHSRGALLRKPFYDRRVNAVDISHYNVSHLGHSRAICFRRWREA